MQKAASTTKPCRSTKLVVLVYLALVVLVLPSLVASVDVETATHAERRNEWSLSSLFGGGKADSASGSSGARDVVGRVGGSGSGSGSASKLKHLNKLDDNYQWKSKTDETGKCGLEVGDILTKCTPKIIDALKADINRCDDLMPLVSDTWSFIKGAFGSTGDMEKKFLNSWDIKQLKPDLTKDKSITANGCGKGTIPTPDNSNEYHKNTKANICEETVTVNGKCFSSHAINYYYGGLLYSICEKEKKIFYRRGRVLFNGYLSMKDKSGTNWLKDSITYWFNCGYSQNLGCFTSTEDVKAHSDWYDGTSRAITEICKPCEHKLNKLNLWLNPIKGNRSWKICENGNMS